MKGYWQARLNETLMLSAYANHNVEYKYDDQGRITDEIVTGGMQRTTKFTYDSDDNIDTETITVDGKTIVRTYTYMDGNVSNVSAVVS